MEPLFLLPGKQPETDLFRGQGDGHSLAKSVDRGESHRYDIGVTYTDPAL